jgi:hypothetical protein
MGHPPISFVAPQTLRILHLFFFSKELVVMKNFTLVLLASLLYMPMQNVHGQLTTIQHDPPAIQTVRYFMEDDFEPSKVFDNPGDTLKAETQFFACTAAGSDHVIQSIYRMNGDHEVQTTFVPAASLDFPVLFEDTFVVPEPEFWAYGCLFEAHDMLGNAADECEVWFGLPSEQEGY